jgi:hypothetical protein
MNRAKVTVGRHAAVVDGPAVDRIKPASSRPLAPPTGRRPIVCARRWPADVSQVDTLRSSGQFKSDGFAGRRTGVLTGDAVSA